MKNISQAQVRELPVPRFSTEEQRALLDEFEAVHTAIAALDREAASLRAVQTSLLDEIFGGN